MKYTAIAAALSAAVTCCVLSLSPGVSQAETTQVLVTDSDGLIAALADAKPGDEIILREGIYTNDKWLGKWAAFYAEASGTPAQHIILRSEDPAHPATVCGVTNEKKYALNIIGSYWEIRDLKVCTGAKGIFLAQSEHSIISGCEVYDIGEEGIHIIDDSSYNLVENCFVHDTGMNTPKYGEGVYIGSAKNATDYGFECHYNTVRGCRFGPNIAADHVDIKEYTVGNLVEDCVFDGTGMQGENGGDSFVEIKGNHCTVRRNVGYRNGCEKQLYGFDMNVQLDGWGQDNKIYENTLYLDTADCYVVKGWNTAAQVFRNTVDPPECTCDGNLVMQVTGYRLAGDATEDGACDAEDAVRLSDTLLTRRSLHISGENADLTADGILNAKDLTLMKQQLLCGETGSPEIAVRFVQEDTGKWRMTNGLGGHTVHYLLQGQAGCRFTGCWGYWDPAAVNEETGKTGVWKQFAVRDIALDGNGQYLLTVELPEKVTSAAVEVWDYMDDSGKLDKDGIALVSVTTES